MMFEAGEATKMWRPKAKLHDRADRRAAEREVKYIEGKLLEIVLTFEQQLFEDPAYTYDTLYRHYLRVYVLMLEQLLRQRKPKYTMWDFDYFMMNYKPVEG